MESNRRSKLRLRKEVYLILGGILLLALAIQVTHLNYVLGSSENKKLYNEAQQWKQLALEATPAVPPGKPICVAYDGDDADAKLIADNAERLVQYMKKNLRPYDAAQGSAFDPTGCEAVIMAISEIGKLGNPDDLAAYVERGGYVFIAETMEPDDDFYRLYRKLGIVNIGEFARHEGIRLLSNVLIGQEGLVMDQSFLLNDLVEVELSPESRVLAATGSDMPILWDIAHGKGKFMVFNGTMLIEKYNRGFMAGALSMLIPDFIYPIFNAKLMYIDDFPAPIRKGIDEKLYEEYNRDIPTFFRDIWWPQMLKAANRNQVRYTAVLIESYNDNVEGPFENPVDADVNGLIKYGREIIKNKGEIGLHGYNHQSLDTDPLKSEAYDYKPWKDVASMSGSIREAARFMKSAFPNYNLTTYVPPSNMISDLGIQALKEALPGLAIIASIYIEDSTGLGYVQEFEFNIDEDGVLNLPRITSGYSLTPNNQWAMWNAVTAFGYISHFVHPDDIFDSDRNNDLGWKELYKSYEEMLDEISRRYPWIRGLTATEAGNAVASEMLSKTNLIREGNELKGQMSIFQGDAYFILRTDKPILSRSGCQVERIDKGTYLVTAKSADFSLNLGG